LEASGSAARTAAPNRAAGSSGKAQESARLATQVEFDGEVIPETNRALLPGGGVQMGAQNLRLEVA